MDRFSFLNAIDSEYLAEQYDQYLQFPDSIEPSWRAFFQGFDFARTSYGGASEDEPEGNVRTQETIVPPKETPDGIPEKFMKEFQVVQLINAYQSRGHLFTKTNPVRERRNYSPTLDIANFGLSEADMDTPFQAGELLRLGKVTLRKIIDHLKMIFCKSIGVEYMHIPKPDVINWIQVYLGRNENQPSFSKDEKRKILEKLNEAISFEAFLNTKYVGQKRFSLEGNETLIPGLSFLIEAAAEKGVSEFVMGMAHRGRLNTLANIFGKSAKAIFLEFEGKDYRDELFDGDVKYHLGWTIAQRTDSGHGINLHMAPNPSHLEAVGAVVQGIVRAKQDDHHKDHPENVLPILVHGDAALAGQGAVYETVQMSQLDGFKTQGTIHIVINNQIGFTTNYTDGRSSIYCTDVAKITQSPVLHINADDAEAVVHGILFALDFRMHFKQDVFIDLLGYRKYGHNEGDEPRFTQPKLYKLIAKHSNARDIYAQKLLDEGIIEKDHVKKLETAYKEGMEKDYESSLKEDTAEITPFMQEDWGGMVLADQKAMLTPIDTGFDLGELTKIAEKVTSLPKDLKFLRKTQRLIEKRRKMYFEDNELDWGMAEILAYGSLLKEGYDVHLTGQDSERGTFSHRHAVLMTEDNDTDEVVLLNYLEGDQKKFYIYNSPLNEYSVLGFEYGYAMASPSTLAIWEAQFGDFSNGAQIIIDQYISAAEDKWKLQNGLVLYLPHGYEGQGSEHSSARMERYLQLCARDNMFVVDCTTPANMFHVLRRQVKVNFRKPLIIFTPKSLLRHPKVKSTKEEFAEGGFQMLIDDPDAKVKDVKSLVFCSGKFYYDLLAEKEEKSRNDVALVRIEQLFPLPVKAMRKTIKRYKNAHDIVWAQEEPENMGAYSHLLLHFAESHQFRRCSRDFFGAPASGSAERFKRRQKAVIDSVFDTPKN